MSEVASTWVSVLPTAKGFGSKLTREVSGDVKSSGKKLGSSFGKVFGAVAAIGIGAKAFGFLKGSLDEAREAAVVGARTDNVIKKMGASAWISSKQVGALAGSLSAKAGVDDEAIQSGQNLLLTFGNLRNEAGKGNAIFNQTSGLMVDMSVAMGQDMKSSAVQLGKALNDPIKGVSALSRVGVSFTAQQKEQIKALQDSGDMLGAQKIILGEVKKQFGGAAEAMATPAQKAAVAWGNFKETLGSALLPVVDRVLNAVTPFLVQMGERLPKVLSSVKTAVRPVVQALGGALAPVLERVVSFIKANPTAVKAFAIALGVLAAAIGVVTLATAAFSLALNSTGIPLLIIGIAALVAGLVYAYQHSSRFRAIVDQVGASLAKFAGFLRDKVLPVVLQTAAKVRDNLQPVFVALVAFFKDSVAPVIAQLVAKFRQWQPTIQRVIEVVLRLYGRFLEFYTAVAGKVLPIVLRFAGFLLRTLVPIIIRNVEVTAKIIGKIIAFGAALVAGGRKVGEFATKVKTKIGDVVGYFRGLPGRVVSAVGDLGSTLYDAGKRLIQGFIDGIKAMADKVKDAASGVAGWVKDRFPGSPVKAGPLRSWNNGGAGKRLMGMLADGIDAGAPSVHSRLNSITDKIAATTFRTTGLNAQAESTLSSTAPDDGEDTLTNKGLAEAVARALHEMGLTLRIGNDVAGRVVLAGQNVIDTRH